MVLVFALVAATVVTTSTRFVIIDVRAVAALVLLFASSSVISL